jgi:hypothetical protein
LLTLRKKKPNSARTTMTPSTITKVGLFTSTLRFCFYATFALISLTLSAGSAIAAFPTNTLGGSLLYPSFHSAIGTQTIAGDISPATSTRTSNRLQVDLTTQNACEPDNS